MTNIQSKSLIPFCKFIDKSVIHVSIFYMHCVRQLLIHFLYIDAIHTSIYKLQLKFTLLKLEYCCCVPDIHTQSYNMC